MAHELILVVDDQPANIKLILAILAGEGYQVSVAANATEALESVKRAKPELILMDIHLPGLGGLELTRFLKSNPESRFIKIVATSAYGASVDERQILDAGCDGYLPKPIDTQTFANVIRRYLES